MLIVMIICFLKTAYPPVSVGFISRELITDYVSQTSVSKKEWEEKNRSESRAQQGPGTSPGRRPSSSLGKSPAAQGA
jgi:hypothetical protein